MTPQEFYNEAKQIGKTWWLFLILGFLALAMGIWMVCDPVGTAAVTAYFFAAYFILSGIVDFVIILMHRQDIHAWGWPLLLSVIVFGFGIALFCAPLISASILGFLFAFAIIALGVRFISICVLMERNSLKVLVVLLGILLIASGVMCIFNPFESVLTVATIEGLAMIFIGVTSFLVSYELSVLNSKRKKFEKALRR